MKYKNTKTGFVFETPCKLKGQDWVEMPSPSLVKEKEEKKPVRAKKEKKDE